MTKLLGCRPKPRVAIVGEFEANEIEYFYQLFPTVWKNEEDINSLPEQVDVYEIDLLIIGGGVNKVKNWHYLTNVICFSSSFTDSFPGPVQDSLICFSGSATTEEYLLPKTSLSLSRLREKDFSSLINVKDWCRLKLDFKKNQYNIPVLQEDQLKIARSIFNDCALIKESYQNKPLAIIYTRLNTKLGVAWLPNPIFDCKTWVEAICMQWATIDIDSFPNFKDWTTIKDWMILEEINHKKQISALEVEKSKAIQDYNKKINDLNEQLKKITIKANKGLRRLLTAQGDDLVDEVENSLKKIGFSVERMDPIQEKKNKIKREDLRIQLTDWEAIIEVRGYSKSAGNTRDLQRISRFAILYFKEKNKLPDKRIYIINGQIDLAVPHRQKPLESAPEDIETFSEDDGLIISTLDLFKAVNAGNKDKIKISIKDSVGLWDFDETILK